MTDGPDHADPGLAAALREYLEAEDAGRAGGVDELVTRHPEYRDELTAYFETADHVGGCAGWLSPPTGEVPAANAVAGYVIRGEIGRGGMGVVYEATHPLLDRTVALKLLRADESADAGELLREARAAARLDHPGIVPIFEVGEYGGRPFLAMAYVPGGTLAARVARGPLPCAEAARVVREVALAVQHAHERGVIHRDLKPANVLMTAEGRPMVADFGLAKRSGEVTLSAEGRVLGTPGYMPPEFAAGHSLDAGPAADVYGLGAILYALLTGRPPFRGDTPLETIRRVADDEPAPPRALNPRVERAVQAICLRCLEKDPRHRYGSARELAEDLDRYLNAEVPLAEQLGWGEWLGRKLDRAPDFRRARAWSRLLATAAAGFATAHVGFSLATGGATSGAAFWLAFLAALALSTWLPCLAAARMSRLDPRERGLIISWVGVSLGQVLLFAGRCPPGGDADPAQVDRFFADSAILYGVTFLAQAGPYWGRFYLFGVASFAAAVAVRAAGPAAPLVYGAWQAVTFALIARHLHRLAQTQPRTSP